MADAEEQGQGLSAWVAQHEAWLALPDGSYSAMDAVLGPTRADHGLLVGQLGARGAYVLVSRLDETLHADGAEALLTPRAFVGSRTRGDALVVAASRRAPLNVELAALGRRIRRTRWLEADGPRVVVAWTLLEGEPCELVVRPFLALRPVTRPRDVSTPALRAAWLADLGLEPGADGRSVRVWSEPAGVHVGAHGEGVVFEAGADVWYQFALSSPGARATLAPGSKGELPRASEEAREDLFTPGTFRLALGPGRSASISATLLGSRDAPAGPPAGAAPALRAGSRDGDEEPPSGAPAGEPTVFDAMARLRADLAQHEAIRHGRRVLVARHPDGGEHVASSALVCPALLAAGELARALELLAGAADLVAPGTATPTSSVDGALWVVDGVRALRAHGVERAILLDRFYPVCLRTVEAIAAGTSALAMDVDGLVSVPADARVWLDVLADGVAGRRAGKPVELQALWYGALSVTAELASDARALVLAAELRALAKRARASFAATFEAADRGLADRVAPDGTLDTTLRPFQLFALAADPSLVSEGATARAIAAIESQLMAPLGLRTRSADDAGFDPHDPTEGASWPAFVGLLVRASRRARPDRSRDEPAETALRRLLVAAADAPLPPRAAEQTPLDGSPLAWNAAEVLRAALPLSREAGPTARADPQEPAS